MEKKIRSITDVIDMGVVEFVSDCTENRSYSDLNNIHKLLEVEQVRLVPIREQLIKQIAETTINSKEFQDTMNIYISTFVIEKSIMDKIAICEYVMKMKEVKAPRQSSANAGLDKAPRQSKKQ